MVISNVIYAEPLIRSMEKNLRAAFGLPALLLNRKPNKPGEIFEIALSGANRIATLDDGTTQGIAEIPKANGKGSEFYLGFVSSFCLTTEKKYSLQQSTISIFHEIGELTPLFRAEWDYKDATSATSKHAQPHWHFEQHPSKIEKIVKTLSSKSSVEIQEFSPQIDDSFFADISNSAKLHFAMTSLEDKTRGTSYKKVFSNDEFVKWFECLTDYIANQISYIVEKTPDQVTTFNPD